MGLRGTYSVGCENAVCKMQDNSPLVNTTERKIKNGEDVERKQSIILSVRLGHRNLHELKLMSLSVLHVVFL